MAAAGLSLKVTLGRGQRCRQRCPSRGCGRRAGRGVWRSCRSRAGSAAFPFSLTPGPGPRPGAGRSAPAGAAAEHDGGQAALQAGQGERDGGWRRRAAAGSRPRAALSTPLLSLAAPHPGVRVGRALCHCALLRRHQAEEAGTGREGAEPSVGKVSYRLCLRSHGHLGAVGLYLLPFVRGVDCCCCKG